MGVESASNLHNVSRAPTLGAVRLHFAWHTGRMSLKKHVARKTRARWSASSINPELRAVIDASLKEMRKSGANNLTFPVLTGAQAAALMKAAGIVTAAGELSEDYS